MEPPFCPHGYLAVDFFFVLSGFVNALTYQDALRDGMAWHIFAVKRVIRLYPLALLGGVIGLATLMLKWRFFPAKVEPLSSLLLTGSSNCLLLPRLYDVTHRDGDLFPGNPSMWSLFFEMAINLLWAAVAVRWRTRTLFAFTALSAAGFAGLATYFHTVSLGARLSTFSGGALRVCFGFCLGVLLFRLRLRVRLPSTRWAPPALAVLLGALLASPTNLTGDKALWYDLTCIGAAFPLIVVLGVSQQSTGPLNELLGRLSYPLYILHAPVFLIALGLHQKFGEHINVHILAALAFVVTLVLCFFALRFYDEPLRRRLAQIAARHGLSASCQATMRP